jgi:hypothetical protein
MEYILMAYMASANCAGQACCWYTLFNCCGFIDTDIKSVNLEEQPPSPQQSAPSQNPFINPNAPRRNVQPK